MLSKPRTKPKGILKVINLLSGRIPSPRVGRNKAITDRFFNFISDCDISASNIYRKSKLTVRGNHVLVSFINSIGIPLSLPEDRYIDNVESVSMGLARSFGIGTVISEPALSNKGAFYGTQEIIYGVTTIPEVLLPWHRYKPVKVVCHPRTDITYTLLDGTPNTDEDGLAVIQINFVELMLMYRGWQLRERRINPENPAGPVEFVGSWLLPSMMSSHNAVAVVNRLRYAMIGFPYADQKKRTFFSMPKNDYLEKSYREYIIQHIETNRDTWQDILELTTVTDGVTLREFGHEPDVAMNKYGKAMKLLSTMSTINYLLMAGTLGAASNKELNANSYSELVIFLKRYDSEKWFGYSKLAHQVNKYLNDNIISLL